MKLRRQAGFTLVEVLVAAGLSTLVGLIAYGIASEGLVDFARNVSINRSYSNARQSLDRISIAMQSAGHTPVLVDATGADTTSATAAGIRFWRYSSSPLYYINTPAITDSSLTLSLLKPNTAATMLPPPAVGDMITVAVLGFQAQALSVATGGSGTSATATVTFAGSIASKHLPPRRSPPPPLAAAAASAAVPNTEKGQMSCLDWTSVAFIAVNNQLRYFPKFLSGTTNVATPASYQVLTYLTTALGSAPVPLPFSLGPSPSINVDLYAEAPDYNNRTAIAGTSNGSTGLSTANTYTFIESALSPRSAAVFQTHY